MLLYGLAVVLIFTGIVGFGIWMRDQQASPKPSATPAPSASAAAGTPAAGGETTIGDTNGKTVQVTVGGTVYLGLQIEPGYQPWQVAAPDPTVLTPADSPPSSSPGMVMLIFKAVGPGQTTINATSQVDCPPGQQCANTTRHFQETVIVVPG